MKEEMMEDSRFSWVAELGYPELCRLRQEVDEALAYFEHSSVSDRTSDPYSDNISFSAFSSGPTLLPSGRSTPQAGSIASTNTIGFDTNVAFNSKFSFTFDTNPPVHNVELDQSWLNVPSLSEPLPSQTPLPQHPSQLQQFQEQEVTTRSQKHEARIEQECCPGKLPFFCPYCQELNKRTTCKTKQDWKRHQQDFHDTGNEWHCRVSGCSQVFVRQTEFKRHFKSRHRGQGFPSEGKTVIQKQRVYACGFENCRKIVYNWKDFSDHVATEIQEGLTNWSYTRTIRNLLKHPKLATIWKNVLERWCHELGIRANDLRWDIVKTQTMREQLEYHTFDTPDTSLDNFLERLLKVGHPDHRVAASFNRRLVPIYPPLSVAPTIIPATTGPFLDPLHDPPALVAAGHPQAPMQNNYHNIENETRVNSSASRNSVLMIDAPPLQEYDTFISPGAPSMDPCENDTTTWQNFLYTPKYSTNTTPEVPPSIPNKSYVQQEGATRSTPRRSLRQKSKEWLTSKKSQTFHSGGLDHPDLPANVQLPSPPRKSSSRGVSGHGGHGLYSNQS